MYIAIWASLISGIIMINTVNSMLRIYYTTKCISSRPEVTGSISDDDVVDAITFHDKTPTKPVTSYPDGSVRSRVS
jgi:hypothetical protein